MVRKHVQACRFCQEHNKQAVKYSKYNFEAEPVYQVKHTPAKIIFTKAKHNGRKFN